MSSSSFTGQQKATSGADDLNAAASLVQELLSRISTMTLVQVKVVTNAGDISPVGYVDVLPLVNQLDGAGNAVPHGALHNLPYFRLQGGANAVILDPQVGDIGIAGFVSRDISAVKANKAQANPGSMRRFDMADGLYVGGFINAVPSQYVQFSSDGIALVSPTAISLQAPKITMTSPSVQINSDDVAIMGASLTHNGKNIGSTHAHGEVQTGGGVSGSPV